jgi:transcriptional regulator with XRE-family HTH domain
MRPLREKVIEMKRPLVPNDLLKQARLARGWTQSDLAEKMRTTEQTVHSWERGKRFPGREFRRQLCEIFEMNPEELGLLPIEIEKTAVEQPVLSLVRTDPALLAVSKQRKEVPETSEVNINVPQIRRFLSHQTTDLNRQRMLNRVRSTWIEGVFQQSLRRAMLIALGLKELPEALANPWRLEVQETNLPSQPLPPGTRIIQVYDQADGELLVLGEPGAGKTTLLLELAGHLLARAEENDSYPLPVVFNLSSWALKGQPLEDWLVEELHTKYRVPYNVGREWIHTDQLVLLLDGLDEMSESARPACVKAIDAYQREHTMASLVVCCRREEYFATETRVSLQKAVLIQELTAQQIYEYVASAGEQLAPMRRALREDVDLLEMVKTPLLLSIVAMVYQGESQEALNLSGSLDARRWQILDVYIQRMLSRRGAGSRYHSRDVTRWLSWLAGAMQRRGLTELYIERMQPDLLPDNKARQRYRGHIIRLVYCLDIGVVTALFAWLRGGKASGADGVGSGLLGQLGGGHSNAILGWMAPGFGGGVEGGGSLGVLFALVFTLLIIVISAASFPPISWRSGWRGLRQGLSSGLKTTAYIGPACVLIFSLAGGGISHGLKYGLGAGLFCGLLTGLLSGLQAGLTTPAFQAEQRAQRRPAAQRLVDGLIVGPVAAGSFAMVDVLLHITWSSVLIYSSIMGLFFGVGFGLFAMADLIPALGERITPAEIVSWSWGNVGRSFRGNLVKGLLIGLIVMGCVGLVIGLSSGLFYGLAYGVRYGLIYGLIIGLIAITAVLLAGVLNSGWSSDILDAQQIFRPNEGIRRSLLNAVIAAVLFGLAGSLISGLVCAFAFGVVGELSSWLVLSIGFAIVFGVLFALQFLTIHGGIAWAEHYFLRWHFQRAGYMPWNCIDFFDYTSERILLRKVGGGYMFAHRLLLEHFASLKVSGNDAP